MPNFIISHDRNISKGFFGDPNSIEVLGTLQNDLPYNQNDFAYSVYPLENHTVISIVTQDTFDEQNIMSKIVYGQVNNFISALWYVKDNSVSIHQMISALVEYQPSIHSTINFSFFTTCEGKFSDSHFTNEELQKAKVILGKWTLLCPNLNKVEHIDDIKKRDVLGLGLNTEMLSDYDYNKLNRLERSSILLDTARGNYSLPLKISFFIPVFECLFIADAGGEIQQKVCERISFYLTENNKERKQIFNDLKDGYTIRSKFFHGDRIPSKYTHDKLLEISKSIDEIARRIFIRIIEKDHAIFIHDNAGKNDFETFLSELIFKDTQEINLDTKI